MADTVAQVTHLCLEEEMRANIPLAVPNLLCPNQLRPNVVTVDGVSDMLGEEPRQETSVGPTRAVL